MKILFICSKNKWRSLTAERIFDGRNDAIVRSAGTENGARVKVTSGLIRWADLIYVMENKHLSRLQDKFREEIKDKQIINLHIPDEFKYMDEELIHFCGTCYFCQSAVMRENNMKGR